MQRRKICDAEGGVSLTAQFIYHETAGKDILITYAQDEEEEQWN